MEEPRLGHCFLSNLIHDLHRVLMSRLVGFREIPRDVDDLLAVGEELVEVVDALGVFVEEFGFSGGGFDGLGGSEGVVEVRRERRRREFGRHDEKRKEEEKGG